MIMMITPSNISGKLNWRISFIFCQIVTETEQAKKSLADVEARHADIIKLERSIKDLHEMFHDMAILIEGQVGCFIYCRLFYICLVALAKTCFIKYEQSSNVF